MCEKSFEDALSAEEGIAVALRSDIVRRMTQRNQFACRSLSQDRGSEEAKH